MHELAIMESVVAAVVEQVHDARVARVRLEIGHLCGVAPNALRFCFDVCSRGTTLEGAVLQIQEVDGRGICRQCGRHVVLASAIHACACGSGEVTVLAGEELRIKDVEVLN